MSKRFRVVIVGGGPVGMAMAIELGQRGISCAIMERRTAPHRIPKGQGLTQRSMEHFYRWVSPIGDSSVGSMPKKVFSFMHRFRWIRPGITMIFMG